MYKNMLHMIGSANFRLTREDSIKVHVTGLKNFGISWHIYMCFIRRNT